MIERLEDYFSRNWEFHRLKTKEHIQFSFKDLKTRIKGRIKLDKHEILYEVYDQNYRYVYLEENPVSEAFLNAFMVFYPSNARRSEELRIWLKKWFKDRRKRNKPARELYGYSK